MQSRPEGTIDSKLSCEAVLRDIDFYRFIILSLLVESDGRSNIPVDRLSELI